MLRTHQFGLLAGVIVGVTAFAGVALSLGNSPEPRSGVEKGGLLSAYTPTHVTGSDKGTNTCPVCKYPFNPAVQVWINTDDMKNVGEIAAALEKDVTAHKDKKMKAFVVFVNPDRLSNDVITHKLKDLAKSEKIENVALVYLPGPNAEPVSEYKINTDAAVKNTVFVYKDRKVNTKFVNFVANEQSLKELNTAISHVLN